MMNAQPTNTILKRALALIVISVLAVFPSIALAQSATPTTDVSGNGQIVGSVTNGTTDDIGANLSVSMEIFDASGFVEERDTVTDDQGNFTFSNLPTDGSVQFSLSVSYEGVSYGSGTLAFEDGATTIEAPLSIFEPTTDKSAVSITRRGLILTGIDPASGNLNFLDVVTMNNSGNEAVVANDQGRSIEFPVPANASQVTPFPGSTFNLGNATIEGATLFANAPLVPGSSTATLGYTVPYTGDDVSLELVAAYPISEMRVLIPISTDEANKEIDLSSSGLEPQGEQTIGPQTYRVWTAQDVEEGDNFHVAYMDLPESQVAPNTLHTFEPVLIAVGAGLLMLIIIGVIAWRRNLFAPRPVVVNPALESRIGERREELITQLRALEQAHQEGHVSEDDYVEYRQVILEQLRLISRQQQDLARSAPGT